MIELLLICEGCPTPKRKKWVRIENAHPLLDYYLPRLSGSFDGLNFEVDLHVVPDDYAAGLERLIPG